MGAWTAPSVLSTLGLPRSFHLCRGSAPQVSGSSGGEPGGVEAAGATVQQQVTAEMAKVVASVYATLTEMMKEPSERWADPIAPDDAPRHLRVERALRLAARRTSWRNL